MRNPYFRFKQFAIRHDRCAMKVGTDGVLLGAWARLDESASRGACRILDVGIGSGLIAMMLAQRYAAATVEGLDIDEASARQAEENVREAGMENRVSIGIGDFVTYGETSSETYGKTRDVASGEASTPATVLYDLIVSNPPFFKEDTVGGNTARDNARHSSSLPFESLIGKAACLLRPATGRLAVIVPHSAAQNFISLCAERKLYLCRRTDVRAKENKAWNRTLLEFGLKARETEADMLTLHDNEGNRSEAYSLLTRDFYL